MPRLTPQPYKKLAKAYNKLGYIIERETDDHLIFWHPALPMTRPVILPKYKEVGLDIILNNIRSGLMNRAELIRLL